MLEELKKILTEVRSTKGKYHSSEVSNEEIAKVILALIPQGDSEGLLTDIKGIAELIHKLHLLTDVEIVLKEKFKAQQALTLRLGREKDERD